MMAYTNIANFLNSILISATFIEVTGGIGNQILEDLENGWY